MKDPQMKFWGFFIAYTILLHHLLSSIFNNYI